MRIQHNIMAMNAYRNYNNNVGSLSSNLEKLSSGYRINRAGDDAAGLAISEKMRAQITGLDAAQKNVKDGISLVKTAEGAMQEIQDMMNRMKYLATQSANGTYDNDVDRANLQKEVVALKDEINRIADSANFNGQKLLNGELDPKAEFTTEAGTAAIDATAIELQDGQTASVANKAETASAFVMTAGDALSDALIGKKADGSDITLGSGKLGDLFTITGATGDTNTKIADGDSITLEAKTAGALSDDIITALKDMGFDMVNGNDTGAGSAATKATYELEIDLTKVSGGDTFSIGDKTFQFVTDGGDAAEGNIKIDISGLDSAVAGAAGTGQLGMAQAIQGAVDGALGTKLASSAAVAGDITAGEYTLNLTAVDAGEAGNLGQVRVVAADADAIDATYDEGKAVGAADAGKFAQVAYKADLSKLAVGDKINIGGTELEIVEADEADINNGKISLADAQDGAKLAAAFETAGYNSGKISYADGKITITETTADDAKTAAAFAAGNGKLTFTPGEDPAAAETTNGAALWLQIGDTADPYNRLKVEINDMHVEALGIKDLDIGTLAGAQKAVDSITDAINLVSSTRGDLGAIQNRLEHTANNLSVMEENIQDAESTIRDTDVADEMMAYTKNNILIQSAQAMLAQANQVPQGVLQLLQ